MSFPAVMLIALGVVGVLGFLGLAFYGDDF